MKTLEKMAAEIKEISQKMGKAMSFAEASESITGPSKSRYFLL